MKNERLIAIIVAWALLLTLVAPAAKAGMLVYLPLDGDAADKSGNSNNGAVMGAAVPTWAEGAFGQSLELDGVNDYVGVPTFQMTTGSATFAAWIKGWKRVNWAGFDIDYSPILIAGQTRRTGLCFGSNDTLHYRWDSGCAGWDGGPVIPKNQWAMVAVTIGPDGATAYVYTPDGGLKQATNTAAHQTWTVEGLKVGLFDKPSDLPGMFDGCVDEVVVFDQKLSSDQVEQFARLGGQSFVPGSPLLTWTNEVAAAELALQQQSPAEAVTTAEQKLTAYDQWKANNPSVQGFPYQLITADLNLVLAKAKEAASADANEIAAAYIQAVCVSEQRLARRSAVGWLVAHLQADDLRAVFAGVVTNSADLASTCRVMAKQLEAAGQWSALDLFMDVILDRGQEVIIAAKAVDDALSADGTWKTQYAAFCAAETRLEEYVVEKQYAAAEACTAASNHAGAAAIYTTILADHPNTVKKAQVEFSLCKSLYKARQYASAVAKIDTFVAQYGATERRLTIEALVMKGQSLIQLGDVDAGCRAFLIVGTEYADAAEAAEANYFVGNGRMMQSRFDEAKDAFKVVVAEYPESPYATQAAEYITSIESMTE